jgi:hypothetical protein
MTTTQLCNDVTNVEPTDDDDEETVLWAKVDISTPATMHPKLNPSGPLKVSIFHRTATAALVMGSAALTVSTKAAELAKKPPLVARNPIAKQSPASTKLDEIKSLSTPNEEKQMRSASVQRTQSETCQPATWRAMSYLKSELLLLGLTLLNNRFFRLLSAAAWAAAEAVGHG